MRDEPEEPQSFRRFPRCEIDDEDRDDRRRVRACQELEARESLKSPVAGPDPGGAAGGRPGAE